MKNNKDYSRANNLTQIIQNPKKKILTFWDTNFSYFVISPLKNKSILKNGELLCSKPTIITPATMQETLLGFSDKAKEYAEENYHRELSDLRGLGYQFKNTLKKDEILDMQYPDLIDKLKLESTDNTAIVICPEDIWPLGLIRTSFNIISNSFKTNMEDLSERGYFQSETEKKKFEIECLFEEASSNEAYVKVLAETLQQFNLFEEYEDRFFKLTSRE